MTGQSTKPAAGTHLCPRTGCTVQVPREQLACRTHWFALSRETRRELIVAYRNRRRDAGRHRAAIADAIQEMNSGD